MRYEWQTVEFEDEHYEVCVDTLYMELEEITVEHSEANIIKALDEDVKQWMFKEWERLYYMPKLHKEETLPTGWRDNYD